MKTYLKWVGGKTRLIKDITVHIPTFDFYIEPFVGGGSLFFSLEPKNGIMSDNNPNLINTHITVRDNIEDLISLLEIYSTEYKEYEDIEIRAEYFYKKREEYNNIKYILVTDLTSKDHNDRVICAALFIFLNKTAFNGLYRENKKGGYNVPHGKYKNPTILNESLLRSISVYLNKNNIDIRCCSYQDIYNDIDSLNKYKDIVVYNDPPYYQSSTSKFVSYTSNIFGVKEQIELKDTIDTYNNIYILVSNSDCKEIYKLYEDFIVNELIVNRSISASKSKRGKVKEVLITNYILIS
jgi:DNA adenine methylase